MPYSLNPKLVEERRALIAPLISGEAHAWEVIPPSKKEVRRLSQRIRETLYIASQYPLRFPEYNRLRERYRIVEVGAERVEAHPKSGSRIEATSPALGLRSVPIHGDEGFGVPTPVVGIRSAEEAIASWRAHLPSNDKIVFQQTSLDDEEMTKLWEWAQRNKPRLMLVKARSTLTISLPEIGAEKLIGWRPLEVKTEEERIDV